MQNKQLIWQFPNQKIPQIIHAVHVCQGRKKMDNKALFICVTDGKKRYGGLKNDKMFPSLSPHSVSLTSPQSTLRITIEMAKINN